MQKNDMWVHNEGVFFWFFFSPFFCFGCSYWAKLWLGIENCHRGMNEGRVNWNQLPWDRLLHLMNKVTRQVLVRYTRYTCLYNTEKPVASYITGSVRGAWRTYLKCYIAVVTAHAIHTYQTVLPQGLMARHDHDQVLHVLGDGARPRRKAPPSVVMPGPGRWL